MHAWTADPSGCRLRKVKRHGRAIKDDVASDLRKVARFSAPEDSLGYRGCSVLRIYDIRAGSHNLQGLCFAMGVGRVRSYGMGNDDGPKAGRNVCQVNCVQIHRKTDQILVRSIGGFWRRRFISHHRHGMEVKETATLFTIASSLILAEGSAIEQFCQTGSGNAANFILPFISLIPGPIASLLTDDENILRMVENSNNAVSLGEGTVGLIPPYLHIQKNKSPSSK